MKGILEFPNVRAPSVTEAEKAALPPGTKPIEVPQPPKWLSVKARVEWRHLAPLLASTWKPKYEDTLAVYCEMTAWLKADPENFGVARLAQWRSLQADLGLTPRSQRYVDG